MKLGLKDKVVVITGGSKGIGFAAARLFVEEGAHVLISARSEDALNRACDEISTKTGGTVDAFPADVSVVSDLDALTAFVRERYNRVDVLVNNAGTGTYKSFFEVTDDDLEYGMAINFFAQFRLSQSWCR